MAVFQEAGDDAGMAKSWRLLAWSHGTACHFAFAAEASEHAVEHARIAGDLRQQTQAATAYAAAAVFGPTPVPEAVERCERIISEVSGDRHSEGILLALLSSLKSLQGSFDEARELVGRGRTMLEELGLAVRVARVAQEATRVEMYAGDVTAAEGELQRAHELLMSLGEKYLLSTISGLLGQTRYALGQFDEAEPLAQRAKELATEDDVDTQSLWRCVLAKVAAREGEFDEAHSLMREALEILAPTDAILLKYGALLDLAEVCRFSGSDDDARAALEEALELAELKESPVMVAEGQARLAALPSPLVS